MRLALAARRFDQGVVVEPRRLRQHGARDRYLGITGEMPGDLRRGIGAGRQLLRQMRANLEIDLVDQLEHDALEQLELSALGDARSGDLAHGDKKRLDIAIALATAPEILLLDEPVAGMSRDEARKTGELVRKLASSMTVLIIEHDMDLIMGISDSITVLESGRVLASGTPAEIRADQRVQDAYLGGHSEAEIDA